MDYVLYLLIGIIAGATGAASSGGGLLSIPLLLLMGISPISVIATTRLGSFIGGIVSLRQYHRKQLVDWRLIWPTLIAFSAVAGLAGPFLVTKLDPSHVGAVIGTALLALSVLLLVTRQYGLRDRARSDMRKRFGGFLVLPGMLYASMFGAGGGAIIINIMIFFYGLRISKATATGLAIWLVGTGVASIVFLLKGLVLFDVMIPLVIGSALGGYLGADYIARANGKWIKLLLGIVVGASALRLLLA